METSKQILFALSTCNTHAARLQLALSHVLPSYPLTAASFSSLQDEQLSFIEFMISRFSKLQDTIGSKIFPGLINLHESNPERQSFLDILHKLEKWGFLESTDQWMRLREIRNYFAHDYPEHPELMAKEINRTVKASQDLLAYWNFLKEKMQTIRELS